MLGQGMAANASVLRVLLALHHEAILLLAECSAQRPYASEK